MIYTGRTHGGEQTWGEGQSGTITNKQLSAAAIYQWTITDAQLTSAEPPHPVRLLRQLLANAHIQPFCSSRMCSGE